MAHGGDWNDAGGICDLSPHSPDECVKVAYNLGNFFRTLVTPEPIQDWSLTSLREKLIKIGAKVVSHGRYIGLAPVSWTQR